MKSIWTSCGLIWFGLTIKAAYADELHSAEIRNAEQFSAMSTPGGGLFNNGRSLKFLIDYRDPSESQIYYMNGNFRERPDKPVPEYAKYHFFFAEKVLPNFDDDGESFNRDTYFSNKKRFFAGTIHSYELDNKMLYAIQFYPQDVIRENNVLKAIQLIRPTLPKSWSVAFVATGGDQTVDTVRETLKQELDVESLTLESVLKSADYVPMNLGTAIGYLRVFPEDPDALTPDDIPVFKELPLDLSVVAGVITRDFQDTNSHVNLKSKERKTPNMVLLKASPDHPLLAPWKDKLVRITVGEERPMIGEATEAELEAIRKRRNSRPWAPIRLVSEKRLLSYDDMCSHSPSVCITDMSKRFGSKAANLGFLANRAVLGRKDQPDSLSADGRFGYNLSPVGFGIPGQYYKEFVDDPANKKIKAAIHALVNQEKKGSLSPRDRLRLSNAVKELIYLGKLPSQLIKRAQAKIVELKELKMLPMGLKKIKVRSSANAEDIEDFDGAGLYDSFSANLEKQESETCRFVIEEGEESGEVKGKMEPNTLGCTIKGVYASLWNKRAIDERTFARLDHATAAMGIAIVPKYDFESEVIANSVVVTRVINSDDVYGYILSIQKDNNLVTNPDPGTFSENTIASFIGWEKPSFTTTRKAKSVRDKPQLTERILTDAQLLKMVEIARHVEFAYCNAKPAYFNGVDCHQITAVVGPEKPRALDLEFKILANGHFVCKQAREFSGK